MSSVIQTGVKPKKKIYYGWVIVLVAGLASVSQTGYYGPVIGSFVKPVTTEFGWNRSEFIGALTIGSLFGSVTAAIVGPMIDKYGPRWIIVVGAIIMGSMLIASSFIQNLPQWYLVTIISEIGFGGMVALAITTVIPKWFVKKRGRALAFSNLGIRIGVGVHPFWVAALVAAQGWRMGFVALGIVTLVLTVIPSALFMRRRPEDMGLRPDGETDEDIAKEKQGIADKKIKVRVERSFTLKEVRRMKSFYVLLFSFCIVSFAGGGILIHLLPLMTDRGLSSSEAATVILVWSSVGMIGTIGGGFLSEKMKIQHIAAIVYAVIGVGIFLLSQINGLATAYAFAIVHGTIWGAWNNLQIMLFADFYGRGSLGSIRGFVAPILAATGSLAPLSTALFYDYWGTYTPVLLAFVVVMAVSTVIMLMLKPPQPSSTDTTTHTPAAAPAK